LTSLIISICGLPIYQAYEKQMYKIGRIKYINTHPLTQMDGLIKLNVSSIEHLPIGYDWEDVGTEFIHQGMIYDVLKIIKSEKGFTITALADAPEILLDQKHVQLAQQQKESSSKSKQIFKWVFSPYINIQKDFLLLSSQYCVSNFPTVYEELVFAIIEKDFMPPEMN
jgi:hypothetical protein